MVLDFRPGFRIDTHHVEPPKANGRGAPRVKSTPGTRACQTTATHCRRLALRQGGSSGRRGPDAFKPWLVRDLFLPYLNRTSWTICWVDTAPRPPLLVFEVLCSLAQPTHSIWPVVGNTLWMTVCPEFLDRFMFINLMDGWGPGQDQRFLDLWHAWARFLVQSCCPGIFLGQSCCPGISVCMLGVLDMCRQECCNMV